MSPPSLSSNGAERPVALVTGAARRIGAVIAETLHGRGFDLLVHYRGSEDEARALADRLCARREASAVTLRGDLAAPGGAEQLARDARAISARLDLLVNNASAFFPTKVGETTQAEWDTLFGSNLRGPYFLVQALLPALRAAGGNVVNLVDIHAERPLVGHAVYSMAKAGLAMMTRALARELGPEIRVNGVSPGAILWPEDEPDEAAKRDILRRTALRRLGEPADIAGAVAWLALDAPYVTGQVLAVDGGRSLNM